MSCPGRPVPKIREHLDVPRCLADGVQLDVPGEAFGVGDQVVSDALAALHGGGPHQLNVEGGALARGGTVAPVLSPNRVLALVFQQFKVIHAQGVEVRNQVAPSLKFTVTGKVPL